MMTYTEELAKRGARLVTAAKQITGRMKFRLAVLLQAWADRLDPRPLPKATRNRNGGWTILLSDMPLAQVDVSDGIVGAGDIGDMRLSTSEAEQSDDRMRESAGPRNARHDDPVWQWGDGWGWIMSPL